MNTTQSLNTLWNTVRELEKQTNIPEELDAIEGRRFLLRMISAYVEAFVEFSDANNPQFRHSESSYRKMFGDCPDADYLQSAIDLRNGRKYKVRGHIPQGTEYVGVMFYGLGECRYIPFSF